MKLILGSYRGPTLVERALNSLLENAKGITSVHLVDDSGRQEWQSPHESFLGRTSNAAGWEPATITYLPAVGYARAMQAVAEIAALEDGPVIFWEEDFTLEEPTDFNEIASMLAQRPNLAQIALLRGPHFSNEHAAAELVGPELAVLAALRDRLGKEFVDFQSEVDWEKVPSDPGPFKIEASLITQRGTFTCNPAVWAPGITEGGWPQVKWSEDAMRDRLLERGYRFGFLPGVRVKHDGERSGHGY